MYAGLYYMNYRLCSVRLLEMS